MGDKAADRDSGVAIKQRQDGIPDRPADVLEIDVDAVRAGGCQGIRKPLGPVVDRGVEPELIADIGAFGSASGNPNGPLAAATTAVSPILG